MSNAQQAHSKRDVTTTPLQALTLINNDMVFQWSQALAGRVIAEAGPDEGAQIERLYQILFSRKPNDGEKALLKEFLDSHEKVVADRAADGKLTHRRSRRQGPQGRRSAAGLGLCRSRSRRRELQRVCLPLLTHGNRT